MTGSFVLLAAVTSAVSASDVRVRLASNNSTAQPDGGGIHIRLTEPPKNDTGPWELWAGLAGAIRSGAGSTGVTGRIGISRAFGPWRPELELGTGGYFAEQMTVTLMRLGARYEFRFKRITPFLWAALAHQHEMSWEHYQHDPFGAVLGLSDHGEIHRSGVDLGAGVTVNLPRSELEQHDLRLLLRATVTHMLGTGPLRSLDLLLGLGASF